MVQLCFLQSKGICGILLYIYTRELKYFYKRSYICLQIIYRYSHFMGSTIQLGYFEHYQRLQNPNFKIRFFTMWNNSAQRKSPTLVQ